jgi:hypothetical protein
MTGAAAALSTYLLMEKVKQTDAETVANLGFSLRLAKFLSKEKIIYK